MASLATVCNRILSGSRLEMVSHTRVEADADAWALRALPNEDVYLFIKEINNSRVVREANPRERHAAWKMVASGGAVAALLIAVLFPSAYSLLSGYKLETLRTEQMTLVREKAKLELEEAALLNPARLEELARIQQFVDPPAARVVYLDPKAGSLALNAKK